MIDKAIVGEVANRRIAAQHNLTEQAIRRHHAHVARRIQKHEAAQARTLAGLMAKGHQVIDEVLEEDDPELRLKALDRLAKLTELEFGTKSKVETTQRPAPVTPSEERAELAALKQDIADRERELAAQEKGPMQ